MRTLNQYMDMVNNRLKAFFPEAQENSFTEGGVPELLCRSMNYSLLAGGKRLRPSMFLAAAEMLGAQAEQVIDYACAIEMIHSYSLIHDDLPGMDDDTMRRGRATNHVVFGVGQAILAGDGLLNAAFEIMLAASLKRPESALNSLRAIGEIATGSGISGMIAGQVLDLWCEKNAASSAEALSFIQRDKTACMFMYPLRAAGWLADADTVQIDALGTYGEAFGRIFQATDDLLDVLGDASQMGKTLGKDAEQGKLTMVSFYGVEGTRQQIQIQVQKAMDALEIFGQQADFFRKLIASMVDRTH